MAVKDKITYLSQIATEPYSYMKKYKENNNVTVIGHFCSYTPEEILHAFGLVPFRILGSDGAISMADAHLQGYSCSLVRSALEAVLRGKLDFLSGTLFSHTCDSMQCLADIWEKNSSFKYHDTLVLPVKLEGPGVKDYLIAELERFIYGLEKFTNSKFNEDNLKQSINIYNHGRELLKSLTEYSRANPGQISSADMYRIYLAAMVMPREEFNIKIKALQEELPNKSVVKNDLIPIVVAGGFLGSADVLEVIDKSGGLVVSNDLCTGQRYFEADLNISENPLEAIANRMLERPICPAKHVSLEHRGNHLLRLVNNSGAKGVILLHLKFCDPHAYDYPYLRQTLEASQIPSLILEIDTQAGASGQLRTRIEAFMEMLEGAQ